MTTEAQQLVENLLNDEAGQPLPPTQPGAADDTLLDPKAMANAIHSEEEAELAQLRKTGEVNPRTVKQYDMIYHRTVKNADGTAGRAKVTSIKTLKTRPDDWTIGWKHGLKTYGTINKHNAGDWTTIEPPPVPRQKRR
jgi:hypothetical protein